MHHARHIGGPILIGLGVGIDYSLFILTRTLTGLRRGLSVEEAVTAAAGTVRRAVLFAGITVCIALLGIPRSSCASSTTGRASPRPTGTGSSRPSSGSATLAAPPA